MKRRWIVTLGAVLALAMLAGACGSDSTSSSSSTTKASGTSSGSGTVKAAWILVGPKNDGGWSEAHYNGIKAVEKALGTKVETTYKEKVPEGPETTQVIEDLVKDGNTIIFATSFGYGDAMTAAAKKYPDVKFEWATGPSDAVSDNVSVYYGTGEDTVYLAGMAAGAATKKNEIGFVAPFPIPEVIRHINAYALGAQSVNPDAKVKVVWINSWFDPEIERKAAESLIQGGADVIANGGDSPAPGEAAKAADVAWTGYDSDQSSAFPSVWLTAAIYDWGPYYTKQVSNLLDGTWKSQDYYGNIADGFTDIAPFGTRVTADTQSKIEARKQELSAQPQSEFTGPLTDQAGTVKVKDGVQMTNAELQTMAWFVKGVEGNPEG